MGSWVRNSIPIASDKLSGDRFASHYSHLPHSREEDRFAQLRGTGHAQAGKIRELDRLLLQPAFAEIATNELADYSEAPAASSERSRRANIASLAAIRRRHYDDLLSTLGKVRELVTMIHLAKYSGAPASRAEELLLQIANSTEALSEVALWRGDKSLAD
jgi:hypothetical protein